MKAISPILRVFLLISLAVMALLSLGRILTKPKSGIDFFSLIWYPGHFVWQGMDPYAAALDKRVPNLPVHYWDGFTATEFLFPIDPMPTNPAPLVLLFSPLARLSWPVAMGAWTFLNVALLPVVAWAIICLFGYTPFSYKGVLLLLVLCSLIATREVMETGQTTLVTLSCMLMALVLAPTNQILAGLLMGVALSKYSLTFPGFLYFLYKRWYRGALVSLGVQLGGILILAAISQTAPHTIVVEYIAFMLKHVDMPGFHLTAALLNTTEPILRLVPGILSVGLFLALAYWYWLARVKNVAQSEGASITLLVVIMQWNLLVLPHRRYDHVAEILFLALIILWAQGNQQPFHLSRWQSIGVSLFAGLAFAVWSMPLYYVLDATLYKGLFSCFSLAALACSVWLLFRLPSRSHTMSVSGRGSV